MHFEPRLVAGVATAVAISAGQAWAQTTPAPVTAPLAPPETLETPYEEPPPPPPPPSAAPPPSAGSQASPPRGPASPPPVAVPAPASPEPDTRPLLSIRARRKLALTAELGWNGLAGLGPVFTYHVHPHFSLDLGAGFSLLGWKAGVRSRYNFLKTPLTPFVGLGFNGAGGQGRIPVNAEGDPNHDPAREPVTVDINPSYLVQGVVGIDYVRQRGFTLVGCVGYAHLLNQNNYEVLEGELTEDEEFGFNIVFKGGLVLSLAMGYSFE